MAKKTKTNHTAVTPALRPGIVKIAAPATRVEDVDDGAMRTEKGAHIIVGSLEDWLRPKRGPVLDPVLMADKKRKKKKGGRAAAGVATSTKPEAGADGMPRPTRGSR